MPPAKKPAKKEEKVSIFSFQKLTPLHRLSKILETQSQRTNVTSKSNSMLSTKAVTTSRLSSIGSQLQEKL